MTKMAIEWVEPDDLTLPPNGHHVGTVWFDVSDRLVRESDPASLAELLAATVRDRIEGMLRDHPIYRDE